MKLAAPSVQIFLDLETTGLYPQEAGASILEVGMLAVEAPSFREVDSWSVTIKEPGPQLQDPLAGCSDYVRTMHRESGLAAELARDIGTPGGPVRLMTAIAGATAFYLKHASGRRAYLAGANPDFDRRWLEVHMPAVASRFHYRGFDTNAFFVLREFLVGVEKSNQKHRVLDDCRQAARVVHDHFDLMRQLFGAK